MMKKIINVHFPNLEKKLTEDIIKSFYQLRELEGIEKKPATRELINWIRALNADSDFNKKKFFSGEIPFLGVLFKKSGDYNRALNIRSRRRF